MTQNKFLRYSTIAASEAIVASGRVFPRHSLPSTTNKLEPEQFCPGDTIRASFDFLGAQTCQDRGAITFAKQCDSPDVEDIRRRLPHIPQGQATPWN